MVLIITFLAFISAFFFLHTLKRLFEHTYLWQVKEYRWDRMRVHLKEKSAFKKSVATIIALLATVGGVLLLFNLQVRILYLVIIFGFAYFVYSSLTAITKIASKKLIRPAFTIRNILITVGVLILIFVPFILTLTVFRGFLNTFEKSGTVSEPSEVVTIFPTEEENGVTVIPFETAITSFYFTLLFAFDLLLPLFVTILVAVTSIFSSLMRKKKVAKAKTRISRIENLKIVGITGSFGKTTTKELLFTILSTKFKTYMTPRNVNTDIGVANTILNNIRDFADVFIVEMGAYKRGEIKAICDITPPDIAVLTAISDQHLALFGTIENTLKAKYEIVENSKKDTVIVLNGDDDMVLRVAGKSPKKEVVYSIKKELDVWASDIRSKNDRLVFNVHAKGKTKRFEVRILGEYNVSNVLAATAVALQLGMKLEEIAKALKEGSQKKQIGRLSIKRSKFGYRVIDDSYNSNFNGFLASLDLLDKGNSDRRILVTIGILELGSDREKAYKQLAEKIVEVCDTLLTSDEELVKSVKRVNKDFEIVFDKGVDKQLNYLRNKVGKNDVVLFEGPNLRLTQEVLK
jgi:UDP-N-acetylmuramoyl-tripeptide--D-alanyl-D-alanine ligase